MLFEGQTIKVDMQDGGIAELRFDRSNEAVNKLDALAFGELSRALDAIKATAAIKGGLITSAKEVFIVGADIFEFTAIFARPEKDSRLLSAKIARSSPRFPSSPSPQSLQSMALRSAAGLRSHSRPTTGSCQLPRTSGFLKYISGFFRVMVARSACRA